MEGNKNRKRPEVGNGHVKCKKRKSVLDDFDTDGTGRLPESFLLQVLKRLPPQDVLSAGLVSTGWLKMAKLFWSALENITLTLPTEEAHDGFFRDILPTCRSLVTLWLTSKSHVSSSTLASITVMCPKLDAFLLLVPGVADNHSFGEALSHLVAEGRCLTTLKVGRCLNVGGLVLSSNSLCILWLSHIYSVSGGMAFNCPNLKEISLVFSREEKDSTNLTNLVDCLAISCRRLQIICISSSRISDAVVLALVAANFRKLRTLSLRNGSEITDALVAAITSRYTRLEELDLCGSSISARSIVRICAIFPCLVQLMIGNCHGIPASSIEFIVDMLPLLELLDCIKTIHEETETVATQRILDSKRKTLNIRHPCLEKLYFVGCSGLKGLKLDCPKLSVLYLDSCRNLLPGKLQLRCPCLETIRMYGCPDMLINSIQDQLPTNVNLLI